MASMRDGLGGEELAPSGAGIQPSGTVKLHPYFPGSITSLDQISGTDVYATTSMISDSVYGDVVVSGLAVKGATITTTAGQVQSTVAGSTYGAIIQAGSVHFATAGSDTVQFATTYAGVPAVVVSIGSVASAITRATIGAGSLALYTNQISAGSFQIVCELGSGGLGYTDGPLVNWISVGI